MLKILAATALITMLSAFGCTTAQIADAKAIIDQSCSYEPAISTLAKISGNIIATTTAMYADAFCAQRPNDTLEGAAWLGNAQAATAASAKP